MDVIPWKYTTDDSLSTPSFYSGRSFDIGVNFNFEVMTKPWLTFDFAINVSCYYQIPQGQKVIIYGKSHEFHYTGDFSNLKTLYSQSSFPAQIYDYENYVISLKLVSESPVTIQNDVNGKILQTIPPNDLIPIEVYGFIYYNLRGYYSLKISSDSYYVTFENAEVIYAGKYLTMLRSLKDWNTFWQISNDRKLLFFDTVFFVNTGLYEKSKNLLDNMFVIKFFIKTSDSDESFKISAKPQYEIDGSGEVIQPNTAQLDLLVLQSVHGNFMDPTVEIYPKSYNEIPIRFYSGNLVTLKVEVSTPLMSKLSYSILIRSQTPEVAKPVSGYVVSTGAHVLNVNKSSGSSSKTGENFHCITLADVSNIGADVGNPQSSLKNKIELEVGVKLNETGPLNSDGYTFDAYVLFDETNKARCENTAISEFESSGISDSTLVPIVDKNYVTQPTIQMEISVDSSASYMANEDFSVKFDLELGQFFADSIELVLNMPVKQNNDGLLMCYRNSSIDFIGDNLIDSSSPDFSVEPSEHFENLCKSNHVVITLGTLTNSGIMYRLSNLSETSNKIMGTITLFFRDAVNLEDGSVEEIFLSAQTSDQTVNKSAEVTFKLSPEHSYPQVDLETNAVYDPEKDKINYTIEVSHGLTSHAAAVPFNLCVHLPYGTEFDPDSVTIFRNVDDLSTNKVRAI